MDSPLVSPQWLYEHLGDRQLQIVDCRFSLTEPQLGRQQYEVAHIPGAHYLDLNQDLSSAVQAHGGRHPLPDVNRFADKLGSLGIQSGEGEAQPTFVVAYDDSNFAFASRLWWLLRYLGHDAVAVLDGGWRGWQAQGYPVTDQIPEPQVGTFVPKPQSDWIVKIDTVKAAQASNVMLIDSRAPERYRGEVEPIDPIAGHIPGAVNYPWQQVVTDQGYLRSPAELQQHWADLQTADDIIIYCGSGVTACVNLLSMAAADLPSGKLYVGGWSDWCSYLVDPEPDAKKTL